jgi:hypothetical protein
MATRSGRLMARKALLVGCMRTGFPPNKQLVSRENARSFHVPG